MPKPGPPQVLLLSPEPAVLTLPLILLLPSINVLTMLVPGMTMPQALLTIPQAAAGPVPLLLLLLSAVLVMLMIHLVVKPPQVFVWELISPVTEMVLLV